MKFPFTKMHGLGNDFVVFDFTKKSFDLTKSKAIEIADRHFGIGCDQILLVETSSTPDIDFKYRIFNADGNEVGQCGNGARCFAVFIREQGISDKSLLTVETKNGVLTLQLDAKNDLVTVNMGIPNFEPKEIPLTSDLFRETYQIKVNDEQIKFSSLSIGNPHAVIIVDALDDYDVETVGLAFQSNQFFPEKVNVGFMQIIDRNHINLRVFERGVGETIACGSGACAAVVSGIQSGVLDSSVTSILNGGSLLITWDGEGSPVMMSGPAKSIFTGEIVI